MELQKIIETLVKALVSEPGKVEINTNQEGDKTLVFEIRVAKQDMGKIIGKKGKTIESIRTIAGASGVKQNKRCIVKLIEDE